MKPDRNTEGTLLGLLTFLVVGQAFITLILRSDMRDSTAALQSLERSVALRFTNIEAFAKHATAVSWFDLDTNGGATRGAVIPEVQIVEFADFECPACALIADSLHDLVGRNADRVQLMFRHLPLQELHPHATAAALAAVCAGRAGRFWEYHDALFKNQHRLAVAGVAYLKELADSLGIGADPLIQCAETEAVRDVLLEDRQLASRLVVLATPTLFINGKRVEGTRWELIKGIVDSELERAATRRRELGAAY